MIHLMKFKPLLTLTFVLFSMYSYAQSTPSPVTIRILKGTGPVVKYEASNKGKETCWYYIGLEQQQEGDQWSEIVLDIKPGIPQKSAVIKNLAPMKVKIDSYAKISIPKDYLAMKGQFRLKLTYRLPKGQDEIETFSEPFDGM